MLSFVKIDALELIVRADYDDSLRAEGARKAMEDAKNAADEKIIEPVKRKDLEDEEIKTLLQGIMKLLSKNSGKDLEDEEIKKLLQDIMKQPSKNSGKEVGVKELLLVLTERWSRE